MKGFFCTHCGDIRGLLAGTTVVCRCERCCGGWDDPLLGLAWYFTPVRSNLWGLGFHNGFLTDPILARAHKVWEGAEGYQFLTYQSPVVKFRPGHTSDTRWAINVDGDRSDVA